MARSIIIGNWKMYVESVAGADILATTIRNNIAGITNIETVLCPPAIWLTEIAQIVGRSAKLELGCQNLFYEPHGAYTGEISPLMVKEVAKYAIVGHSERREHFGETNFDVNEKVLACLKAGLRPIICVGERKRTTTLGQPVRELGEALQHVPKKYYKDVIVAYEPVWAIGTGDNAEPEYVARTAVKLRELVDTETPILYGGSVNSGNIGDYAERPEINGVLAGGASVRAGEFVKICKVWGEKKSLK